VSNIAEAHILAVDNLLHTGTAAGEAFFITNGEPITGRDLCMAIWKEFGHTPPFQVKIPRGLAWWLGWSLEWMAWVSGQEARLSRGLVLDAVRVSYMNISKAGELLRYVPRVGLSEGLRISCQASAPHRKSRAHTRIDVTP
jgi:sterol-4alpha-carboxylate 3-dehydrogenase (decarboxylating)